MNLTQFAAKSLFLQDIRSQQMFLKSSQRVCNVTYYIIYRGELVALVLNLAEVRTSEMF